MIQVVSVRAAASPQMPSGVRRLVYRSAQDGLEDWALLWPPESGRTWVVNLHGHGSHGDQLYTRADLRPAWLPPFRRRGLGVLTPNLRDNAWMSPWAAADLQALLALLREKFGAGRFVFVSGSMGGTSNLIYAALFPEDVAGLAAMCPASSVASLHDWCAARADRPVLGEIAAAIRTAYGGTPAEVPAVYERHSCLAHADRLTMPVFVAHGDADELIPVGESRALVPLLRGGNLKYREIPGGGHDAPLAEAFLLEALDWILGPSG
jgi:pimeloyl-ACP methyl ester carboxylesterase